MIVMGVDSDENTTLGGSEPLRLRLQISVSGDQ